jgi:ubiquinone/menaquinone biosynthesis C-methylase UbiE
MDQSKAKALAQHLCYLSTRLDVEDGSEIIVCDVDETPLERQVRQFYDELPYHKDYPQEDMATRVARLRRDWSHWIVPVTLEGKRTLDIGCGCGFNLALHGALASVTVGIDVSLSALRQARRYVIEQGVSHRVSLIRGDIRQLDLPDRSFDLITCVGVLHHIPDHATALANMARLLDAGGALLLGLYHPGGRFWHRLRRQVLRACLGHSSERQVRWARRLVDIEGEAQRYHIPEEIYVRDSYAVPFENAFSVRRMARELGRVGLTLIQVRPSPTISFSPDVEERARTRLGPDGRAIPVDVKLVDRTLARARRHHYWCLAQSGR